MLNSRYRVNLSDCGSPMAQSTGMRFSLEQVRQLKMIRSWGDG